MRHAISSGTPGRQRRSGSGSRSPSTTDPLADEQGHAPYAWSLLGAVSQVTERVELMTYGGVNADLPTPHGFAAASQSVRPDDAAGQIPCGPDLDAIVGAVTPSWEASFTHVALVQVGDEGQQRFLDEAAAPLLEKLTRAAQSPD